MSKANGGFCDQRYWQSSDSIGDATPKLPRTRWSYPLYRSAVDSIVTYPKDVLIGFELNPAHLRSHTSFEVIAPLSGEVKTVLASTTGLGRDSYRVEILSEVGGVARIFNILSLMDDVYVDAGDSVNQGTEIGAVYGPPGSMPTTPPLWACYLNWYHAPGGHFVLPTDMAAQMGGLAYLR